MPRKFRRHINHIRKVFQFDTPVLPETTQKKDFEFLLNKNQTDKLHCCIQTNKNGKYVKIADITFLIFHNNQWEWVVRYDDHGGQGFMHRHERVSLKDESETTIPLPVRKNGNKKKLTEWAIDDVRKNYLHYRRRFLDRSKVALY